MVEALHACSQAMVEALREELAMARARETEANIRAEQAIEAAQVSIGQSSGHTGRHEVACDVHRGGS